MWLGVTCALSFSVTLSTPMVLTLQPHCGSSHLIAGEEYNLTHTTPKFPPLLVRLLCRLGFHDFRMINKTFGFGTAGGIETVECLRCGVTITRQA
jgi:hypothetical protein